MAVAQVAITALSHYLQKGDPYGPAVGVVSVLYAGESQLNPGSQGVQGTEHGGVLNPSGAFGIASWNGPRQTTLNAYATARGVNLLTASPAAALLVELDFVITEMFNSYPKSKAAWLAALPYAQFIPIFVAEYEDPANPSAESSRSLTFATQLAAAVPDGSVPIVANPSPVTPVTPVPTAPTVPAPGVSALDPALVALIAALAPAIESLATGLAAGLIKALVSQVAGTTVTTTTTPVVTTPATPAPQPSIDLNSLANSLIPLLVTPLASSLPALIAAELAKLIPQTTTGAKP